MIKKGFFPKTTDGLEEAFAFVSVDCDLYAPKFSALYTSTLGWQKADTYVHDYNCSEFRGTNKAVYDFLSQYPEVRFFLLTNHNGTGVIKNEFNSCKVFRKHIIAGGAS
jgi:hypothetical protein